MNIKKTIITVFSLSLFAISTVSANVVGAINTTKLASYASSYCTRHNSDYVYLKDGNCTNFVSQCLGDPKAGGLAQARNLSKAQEVILLAKSSIDDADSWFYDKDKDKYSKSWTSATSFSNYMKSQRRCTVYDYTVRSRVDEKIADIYSHLSAGDVLQLGTTSSNICHSIMVTSKSNESANIIFPVKAYYISYAQNTSDKTGSIVKIVQKNGTRTGRVTYNYSSGFDSYKFVRIIKTSYK